MDNTKMEVAQKLERLVILDYVFRPQRSTFCVYSTSDWIGFCNGRRMDAAKEGVYLPRTLSAHLHANTEFIQLYFLHEFYGHGSFCEYSAIGKKIVAYERELTEIEKAILGVDELPENTKFKVTNDNPLFGDYKILREELNEYCATHYATYEGFALWLERRLAFGNSLEELHQKRMELVNSSHIAMFTFYENFVKRNGIVALFDLLDFDEDIVQ